jgi:hypothetical protein
MSRVQRRSPRRFDTTANVGALLDSRFIASGTARAGDAQLQSLRDARCQHHEMLRRLWRTEVARGRLKQRQPAIEMLASIGTGR